MANQDFQKSTSEKNVQKKLQGEEPQGEKIKNPPENNYIELRLPDGEALMIKFPENTTKVLSNDKIAEALITDAASLGIIDNDKAKRLQNLSPKERYEEALKLAPSIEQQKTIEFGINDAVRLGLKTPEAAAALTQQLRETPNLNQRWEDTHSLRSGVENARLAEERIKSAVELNLITKVEAQALTESLNSKTGYERVTKTQELSLEVEKSQLAESRISAAKASGILTPTQAEELVDVVRALPSGAQRLVVTIGLQNANDMINRQK